MLYCFIGIEVCSFLKRAFRNNNKSMILHEELESHFIRLTILPQVVHELEDKRGQKENILEEL